MEGRCGIGIGIKSERVIVANLIKERQSREREEGLNEWRVESLRDLRAEGLSALYRERGGGSGLGKTLEVFILILIR
jgi:hypothetical protein